MKIAKFMAYKDVDANNSEFYLNAAAPNNSAAKVPVLVAFDLTL